MIEPLLQRPTHLQHRRLLHLPPQAGRDAAAAHLGALGLQPDLACAAQLPQGHRQPVLVMLGAGLGRQPQRSEAAAAVVGQPFEIDHGGTAPLQSQQQLGLAAAGAPPQQPHRPGLLEQRQGPAAEALVAALKEQHRQLERAGQPGNAARTHAATPAVQAQRLTTGRVGMPLQIRRQRLQPRTDDGQTTPHRRAAAALLVKGADLGPFGIAEQGQGDRAGDVGLGEFARTAHIEDRAAPLQEGLHRQAAAAHPHSARPAAPACRNARRVLRQHASP